MRHFTVACPHCESVFPVDPAKVPDAGVRARCTTCGGIFPVEKPEASAGTAPPEAGSDAPEWGAMSATVGATTAAVAASVDAVDAPVEGAEDAAGEALEGAEDIAGEALEEVEEAAVEALEEVEEAAEGAVAEMEEGVEDAAEEVVDGIEATEFDAGFDDEPFAAPEVEEVSSESTSSDSTSSEASEDTAFSAFDDGFGDIALDPGLTDEEQAPADEPIAAEGDDWVIETEEAEDEAPPIEVAPLDTVEAQVRGFQEETFEAPPEEGIGRVLPGQEDAEFSGYAESAPAEESEVEAEAEAVEEVESPAPEDSGRDLAWASGATAEPGTPEAETAEQETLEPETSELEVTAPEVPSETEAAPAGFRFGRRDPHEKAKRLARVLVSDMITYNVERHARALEAGTIPQDFEEEISKSWTEYVDQVGAEMAESTDYWRDALNDVLAKGERLF